MKRDLIQLPVRDDGIFVSWLDELTEKQRQELHESAPFLSAIFSTAPYLVVLAKTNVDFLIAILNGQPEVSLKQIFVDLQSSTEHETDTDKISERLRKAKSQVALLVAIAEIGKVWTTEQATIALSDFADLSVNTALEFLVRDASARGHFKSASAISSATCGLAVFALGKHGGRELNFSSDIDIVAFFDPAADVLAIPQEAARFYSRIVQQLADLLEQRTGFGYVFRTDLRLRPDPGSTPSALSVDAALAYYEARGQNWERAAWIKARQCAGDRGVGEKFIARLAPFIWRKHLDFATIADIQAMKRQINIASDFSGDRIPGHNVKLGHGGIREIEFFTQTQQLIAGGREPNLRERSTVKALSALAKNHWIGRQTALELKNTYWFLRAVENRLQMVNDEQTHILPEQSEKLVNIAVLLGYDDVNNFKTDYKIALETVASNYRNLFSQEEALSLNVGSLVFTGTDDDPATLETLQDLGFDNAEKASNTIRNWHYGRYSSTRSAAARAHLTELIPRLLETISRVGNADDALARFDNFLSLLPMGVQLFALLCGHPRLLELLVAFMASAPRMAHAVIRRVHVVDGLIDPTRSGEVFDAQILADKINAFLAEAANFEDVINRARIIGHEQSFLISAGLISGSISPSRAGLQYAVLAETLLERVFDKVRETFEQRHGTIPGAGVALLAFGKLGSQDMSAVSDLDIILLYDVEHDIETSNGTVPLAITHYFTRLTQRLISAISAPTAEGVLYNVDMRLRPSGNAGPLATSLKSFSKYQSEKAWVWEHLALTRARVICTDQKIGARIAWEIKHALKTHRDKEQILSEVKKMRARLLRDRPARHPLDLKLIEGGLMDLEFIAQSAILLFPDQLFPFRGDVVATLRTLSDINQLEEGNTLAQTYQIMSGIIQITSACLAEPFKDDNWTKAFKELLARLSNYPHFDRLEQDLTNMRIKVIAARDTWFGK